MRCVVLCARDARRTALHVRVVALIAAYNERRFIAACIEHLRQQGVETYLIDNESTDGTAEIAARRLGDGVIGIETFPRAGVYRWRALLERKEQLARELDADWFIHQDADEFRDPPPGERTLACALEAADQAGSNAVNFLEFTFLPTREQPDHDHPDFQSTLRTYYPFSPFYPHQVNAWKATDADLGLSRSGGHRLDFPGLRIAPDPLPMRHYLFLSRRHAVEKYVEREYDQAEVDGGWHGWRATLTEADIHLPAASELRLAIPGLPLDPRDPRKHHHIARA